MFYFISYKVPALTVCTSLRDRKCALMSQKCDSASLRCMHGARADDFVVVRVTRIVSSGEQNSSFLKMAEKHCDPKILAQWIIKHWNKIRKSFEKILIRKDHHSLFDVTHALPSHCFRHTLFATTQTLLSHWFVTASSH